MKTITSLGLLVMSLAIFATSRTAAQAASPASGAAPTLTALDSKTVRALLARYAHEPSVERVIDAALRASRPDPEAMSTMAARARWRGLVPDLSLGARRGQGVDLRTASAADSSGVRLATDDNLVLEATLRFQLGRLLFASEEVAITREARAERGAREDLVESVVRLYFLRRRLLLERDLLGHTDLERELRIAEAEALLNTFTGGGFQRMMGPSPAWTTGASTRASERP